MNRQTTVKSMKLKTAETPKPTGSELTEKPARGGFGAAVLKGDRLLRNLAVAGGLALLVVAIRNADLPQAQSVFGTLRETVNMEWDESLGRLSFVSDMLPQGVREVWSERQAVQVLAPVVGETVHAWSAGEPYIELKSVVSDVRAVADGEVMSVAHGIDEERIVRIRHDDGLESVYGNLLVCYLNEGDRVYEGDIFARLPEDTPLAFELRRDGRSIDPEGALVPQTE